MFFCVCVLDFVRSEVCLAVQDRGRKLCSQLEHAHVSLATAAKDKDALEHALAAQLQQCQLDLAQTKVRAALQKNGRKGD